MFEVPYYLEPTARTKRGHYGWYRNKATGTLQYYDNNGECDGSVRKEGRGFIARPAGYAVGGVYFSLRKAKEYIRKTARRRNPEGYSE